MSAKVSQKQFHDRVVSLIQKYAEAERQKQEMRGELERIFSEGWVDALEAVLTEERLICQTCNRDHRSSFMAGVRCYDCELANRISTNSAQTLCK